MLSLIWLSVFISSLLWVEGVASSDINSQDFNKVASVTNDPVLLLSTLDGTLIGLNHKTGDLIWKIKNEPTVKVPITAKSNALPIFLPDPKDGSLYLLDFDKSNLLKKLPYSIQDLVAKSPCRSNDGVFYTGKKVDSWFTVDSKTGFKSELFCFDLGSACPVPTGNSLLIGRTEYKIMMYDSKNFNSHWNVTYYDYSSQIISPEELNSYGYLHLSGSSSGKVVTLDRLTGRVLWEADIGSPLVALYTTRNQDIIALPFKSVADTLLSKLPFYSARMYPTLYIGEYVHGLYAFPSMVDSSVPIFRTQTLLIDGPYLQNSHADITGHYQLPDTSKAQLQIAGRSDPVIAANSLGVNASRRSSLKPPPAFDKPVSQSQRPEELAPWTQHHTAEHRLLFGIVTVLLIIIITMFFYLYTQVRDIQLSSRGNSSESGKNNISIETQYGIIRVGKISFNTQHVLGKGCEGTFVFRGEFDGRQVAVKRVLPDCLSLADREVSLLRESDAHPNVIRYFCTENDAQFSYIALELASATLQDFVEKGIHKNDIDSVEILKQATSGLHHLHLLKIVHRDVKPHNILLSIRNGDQKMRAMISDFGLCKKLQNGRVSLSRRSGVTGTDGWIAPEIIESQGRTMCAVDIFSLGCVFYYVLSKGKHPFGEPLRRQSNILSGEYKLNCIDDCLWISLLSSMLERNPAVRPPCSVIKNHPVFWDSSQILAFLQDVSDRLEKETAESEALQMLELGGRQVYGENWHMHISSEVASDLRKYRSYRGDSVRDLLRAFRNKKHHFRELSEEAQRILGSTTDSYVNYWLSNFPYLLYHTYLSLQPLRDESVFSKYYSKTFQFDLNKSGDMPPWFYKTDTSPKKKKKQRSEDGKEDWARSGREAGIWRPRIRHRNRPKHDT